MRTLSIFELKKYIENEERNRIPILLNKIKKCEKFSTINGNFIIKENQYDEVKKRLDDIDNLKNRDLVFSGIFENGDIGNVRIDEIIKTIEFGGGRQENWKYIC